MGIAVASACPRAHSLATAPPPLSVPSVSSILPLPSTLAVRCAAPNAPPQIVLATAVAVLAVIYGARH